MKLFLFGAKGGFGGDVSAGFIFFQPILHGGLGHGEGWFFGYFWQGQLLLELGQFGLE